MTSIPITTAIGNLIATVDREGRLSALKVARKSHSALEMPGAEPGMLGSLVRQLAEYSAGTRATFDVPLALMGTEFQRAVWLATSNIPCGTTRSYGEIARTIGRSRASRAVGAALGANPILLLVPCHRVVGADGSLCGYAGGLEFKSMLLSIESQYSAPVLFKARSKSARGSTS